MMIYLSIIIVNFNTKEYLKYCLNSISEFTSDLNYEIIVVDNASSDGSVEMLNDEFKKIKKIYNQTNVGFASANNQAIKIAEGELILLLNSDTRILDNAIGKTMDFMNENPNASIVGCKLLNPDGTLQPSCRSFPTLWNLFTESTFLYKLFSKNKLFGKYYMSYFDHNSILQVDVVMGAFMMIRREVFKKIGYFDEAYFMYTEETDLCFRAKAHNYKIYFSPTAEIIHYGGGSNDNNQQYFLNMHYSQLQFIRSNFHGINKFLGIILKQLGIVIRIPVYLILSIFTFNRTLLFKSFYYFQALYKKPISLTVK